MKTINNWFEAKIQYDKIGTEDGKQKRVTDTYLVDAVNFTEAEAQIIETVRPYMSGEFTVANLKRTKFYEIFENVTGGKWFKCRVLFVVLDQEKGVEKKIPSMMLVQADDVKEAGQRLIEGTEGTMSDYEIASITETKILDVIPYGKESETKNESEQ